MSQTAVSADLLQALEIVTELAVDAVGEDLGVLAIDNVALPVEEPGWDFVWSYQQLLFRMEGVAPYIAEGFG